MKCFHCKKKLPPSPVLLDTDGDFVCDENCKRAHEEQMKRDMDALSTMSDKEFYNWMGVPELYSP